jgi:hypothetical protein
MDITKTKSLKEDQFVDNLEGLRIPIIEIEREYFIGKSIIAQMLQGRIDSRNTIMTRDRELE